MAPIPRAQALSLYRRLLREARRTIPHRRSYRYVYEDVLRNMIRDETIPYRASRFENTVTFIRMARLMRGNERRLLKNIIDIGWNRQMRAKDKLPKGYGKSAERSLFRKLYTDYDLTMKMVSESLDVYLPDNSKYYERTHSWFGRKRN
ncbi:hypothetical protein POJ06DRAFT_256907 [Lipomyces tetrasporus]|uniref:Uncharacterized protein n=1 Tax=Lipomyces tetrasporus TaxID=54092 RepID=A0AAD7VRP6_9ASCO|nr:uncharacterized protein POJ06DRAFT_256907 [Lipomyces tetrasporus]KAJ8099413.1 hypothetical protein POJ06DRAFT_256907 [Lipomyces tetrasporus]